MIGDVRGPELRRHKPGKYLLEAVLPKVELNPLKWILLDWLKNASDLKTMCYRPVDADRSAEKLAEIEKLALTFEDRPYEQQPGEIIDAVLREDSDRCLCRCCKSRHNKEISDEAEEPSLQSLFCSEVVAAVFQGAGWLKKDRLACRYLPKDFGDGRNANLQRHITDCTIGPPIQIVQRTTEQSGMLRTDSVGDSEATRLTTSVNNYGAMGEVGMSLSTSHDRHSREEDLPRDEALRHTFGTFLQA